MNKIEVKLAGGSEIIDFTKPSKYEFVVTGTGTLSDNYSIQADGNQTLYKTVKFILTTTVLLGVRTFTIFGNSINQKVLTGNSIIELIWNGSTWDIISIANAKADGKKGTTAVTITSSGGSLVLDLLNGNSRYTFLGTATLSNNYTVTATNMVDGDEAIFQYKSIITKGSYDINILGAVLTTEQAINGDLWIYAKYNGSAWVTNIVSDITNLYKVKTSVTDTADYLESKFDTDYFEIAAEKVTLVDDSLDLTKVTKDIEGFAELDITNTQMLSLDSAPLDVILASVLPSANYGILLTHATFQVTPNGGAYTGGGVKLQLYCDESDIVFMETAYLIGRKDDFICLFTPIYSSGATNSQIVKNQPLKIKLSGAIGGGDSSNVTKIRVYYKAIKLS